MSDNAVSCHSSTAPAAADNPFLNGLWKQNPVFVQVLGMCPTLAITNVALSTMAQTGNSTGLFLER